MTETAARGTVLDGRNLAARIRADVAARVTRRRDAGLPPPGLAVLLVGDDPASRVYVRNKERACLEAGFHSVLRHFPADVDAGMLFDTLDQLNADPHVHGILVQLPLPDHIDPLEVIDHIDPGKDVDGYHPYNIGRLAIRAPVLRPCTPRGVMTLLDQTGLPYKGAHAVIVGASNHVGRPMGLELLLAGCTVTTTHKFSRNPAAIAADADILVSAVGRPGLVTPEWIKPGAAVIDVGITRTEDGRLHGDVDFEAVRAVAGWITPVPGGVGPMTVATLLQNTLAAAGEPDA